MGQQRGGWGVRNYFLGIHLSSSREIETQTPVETSKSNNTLTRLTLKGTMTNTFYIVQKYPLVKILWIIFQSISAFLLKLLSLNNSLLLNFAVKRIVKSA